MYSQDNILRGNGMNMAFRKNIFGEIGSFDTSLGAGAIGDSAEETELIYRAKKRGKTICICNEVEIIHKHRINEEQRLQFLIRDCTGAMVFWLKYVIHEMDLFAAKKIYWFISGFFTDLARAIKSHDREKIRLNYYLLLGSLAGLIKGLYIWFVFDPIKSICQKSA